jgi:hypothetical protein
MTGRAEAYLVMEEAMRRRTAPNVAALLASLVLATATAVAGTGPATAGEGDSLRAASGQHVDGAEESVGSDVVVVEDEDDPITVDDLRSLVAQLEATGEVTFAGARRMELTLLFVEHSINRGTPALAIQNLEVFKQVASDPRYVPSAAARDQLIAAADQLIAQLSATS